MRFESAALRLVFGVEKVKIGLFSPIGRGAWLRTMSVWVRIPWEAFAVIAGGVMGNMPAFEAGDFPVRGRACKRGKVKKERFLPEWSSGSRRWPAKPLRFVRIAGSNPASGSKN